MLSCSRCDRSLPLGVASRSTGSPARLIGSDSPNHWRVGAGICANRHTTRRLPWEPSQALVSTDGGQEMLIVTRLVLAGHHLDTFACDWCVGERLSIRMCICLVGRYLQYIVLCCYLYARDSWHPENNACQSRGWDKNLRLKESETPDWSETTMKKSSSTSALAVS